MNRRRTTMVATRIVAASLLGLGLLDAGPASNAAPAAAAAKTAAPAAAAPRAATAVPKAGAACPTKSVDKPDPSGTLVCAKVGKTTKWKARAGRAAATPTSTGGAKGATGTSATTAPATGATSLTTAPATATGGGNSANPAVGSWKTVAGTVAGYRIKENLELVDVEAVGRTENVTGSLTIVANGKTVTVKDVNVVVDMTTLKSDSGRRDAKISEVGLETATFKTATFVSTGPVDLPDGYDAPEGVSVKVPGKLTLHGVTKDVQLAVRARLVDGTIEVIVAHPVAIADYNIEKINLGFVVITENGTIEAKLVMKRK